MRLFTKSTLKDFIKTQPLAEESLLEWYTIIKKANWANHNELKAQIGHASIISDKRVVFNIHGNKYRLVADIQYLPQFVFIVWLGTHKEYDKINVKNVEYDG
jgi:mRNA interferase HigB